MLPSIFYSFLLASALTVSAAPLKAVDDLTGHSLTTGDILSGNEAEGSATVNTRKDGVVPADITKIDPVNVVTEVTKALPVVDNAIPPVDGTTPDPKNIQIIKRPTTDGKIATFKQVEGEDPLSFDFLGGFCCLNGAEVLESGGVEKCQISEECLLEITAFEDEKKTATAILQADKSGALQLQEVKDLRARATGTPEVNEATVKDILKGVKFDKVTVIAKDLGKKEVKRLDDNVVIFVVELAAGTVTFLED